MRQNGFGTKRLEDIRSDDIEAVETVWREFVVLDKWLRCTAVIRGSGFHTMNVWANV